MRILLVVRALLLVALGVDCYLACVSLTGSAVVGCGLDSSCHSVLGSKWAYWWGIPVSAPALMVYLTLFAGTFRLDSLRPSRGRAWLFALAVSLTIVAAGLWFIALQLFVLKAICPWCMAAHASALIASVLVLSQARIGRPTGDAISSKQVIAREKAALIAAVAFGAVALLVLGQLLQPPKTYVSTPVMAGVSTNNPVLQTRQFQIFDNAYKFDLAEVPLLGKPEAEHLIVSVFDYTCHHCRQLHGSLLEAQKRFSNQLAIISLPMPLDPKCNPLVKRSIPEHVTACDLARIGLTVWRADRNAFRSFDDWAFGMPKTPEVAAAEQYAQQLVGSNAFFKAASDPWIEGRLQEDIAIYKTVYERYHKSALPELIIGTNLLSGTFGPNQLFQLLSEQYGLSAEGATNSTAH